MVALLRVGRALCGPVFLPLALLLLPACALFSSRVAVPTPESAPTVQRSIDLGALFGSRSTSSAFDLRFVVPGLMDRIQVEAELLTPGADGSQTELWTQRALLGRLSGHESVLVATGPDGAAPEPPPTAALRDVVFLSGHDSFGVVVSRGVEELLHVEIRSSPDEESLCPPDLEVELGYVQLQGTLLSLPGGEVAGLLYEVMLIPASSSTLVAAELPDEVADPPGFCAALARLLTTAEELERSDLSFRRAAESVLSGGIEPLYVASPDAAPEPMLPDGERR